MTAEPSAIDPICGMTVNPATAKWSLEHNGTTYYFCGKSCHDKFDARLKGHADERGTRAASDGRDQVDVGVRRTWRVYGHDCEILRVPGEFRIVPRHALTPREPV